MNQCDPYCFIEEKNIELSNRKLAQRDKKIDEVALSEVKFDPELFPFRSILNLLKFDMPESNLRLSSIRRIVEQESKHNNIREFWVRQCSAKKFIRNKQ